MFKLSEAIQEKLQEARLKDEKLSATFSNLNNSDLVASARFWMAHCDAPKRNTKDDPVYDSTFWHIILPELLKRLEP